MSNKTIPTLIKDSLKECVEEAPKIIKENFPSSLREWAVVGAFAVVVFAEGYCAHALVAKMRSHAPQVAQAATARAGEDAPSPLVASISE